MAKRFFSQWYVPFLGAAAVAWLFGEWGVLFGMGGKWDALIGAVAGFFGSCVLLTFEWLERTSNAAKLKKEQQEQTDRELFKGLPEQSPDRVESLRAGLIVGLACATFWIPLLGLLITGYAVHLAGRHDMAGWIGCAAVWLLLVSVAVTLIAAAVLVVGN